MTDENPNLFVKLFDENGINTVGNSIGHDLEATLNHPDGTQSTYILNDFYESTIDDYLQVRLPIHSRIFRMEII